MTMLIDDPWLEEQLKEQRRAWGSDHHDEVWQGVYFLRRCRITSIRN